MYFEKTWRWFGCKDSITLGDLKQIGVEGIVTALYDVKPGELWTINGIKEIKDKIEKDGFRWSVVESLPVSEEIKLNTEKSREHIENFKQSLINLGNCGINTVCYNFMPVLDWVRTDIHYLDEDGTETMLFDLVAFAVFDMFILKRPNAEKNYSPEVCLEAKREFEKMEANEKEKLTSTILVYTQRFINSAISDNGNFLDSFSEAVDKYSKIDKNILKEHFSIFINEVVPVAEKCGIKLCIHPDDPAFPLLGLPRIASTIEDFEWIFSQNKSVVNGLTFCAGSLASNKNNDLVEFLGRFSSKIYFAHIRNIQFLNETRFYESGHLKGSVDIFKVMRLLFKELQRRKRKGQNDIQLPIRVDHGKIMLDDFYRESNPGYPLIGRLKGFAEISGIISGIENETESESGDKIQPNGIR